MTSLQQILALHAPILVIDCASARIHVGLIRSVDESFWAFRDDEAGQGLFAALEEVEGRAGFKLPQAGAYVFNDGPGSILGIRTSAVALRTWRSVYPKITYAFQGLLALAESERKRRVGETFTVIADARRESWHCARIDDQGPARLERRPSADLVGPFFTPASFRSWSTRPAGCSEIDYDPSRFLFQVAELPLFKATEAPDAYLTEDPSYVTWTAQVHRAPL